MDEEEAPASSDGEGAGGNGEREGSRSNDAGQHEGEGGQSGAAPSPAAGKGRDPSPDRAVARGDGRIQPNKNRNVQIARTGRRKLFNKAAQKVFLEWFAATCNVSWSAEMAGFNYKTVLRHRMNDPCFAEAWDRAVRQGYARLEAKLVETKRKETPIGIDGDWDAPEMDDVDPHLAMQLLREHRREIAGVKKPGRAPTVATSQEVLDALVKRLKAYGIRIGKDGKRLDGEGGGRAEDAAAGAAPGQP